MSGYEDHIPVKRETNAHAIRRSCLYLMSHRTVKLHTLSGTTCIYHPLDPSQEHPQILIWKGRN